MAGDPKREEMTMNAFDASLERMARAIYSGNCGRAIREMEVYLTAWPEQQTQEKLNSLKADYDMLVSYWKKGVEDPQRQEVYQRLLQRIYVLYANIHHYLRMKASPYQQSLFTRVRQGQNDWSLSNIRKEMEEHVSNVAMLQLEPEHTRQQRSDTIYREHQQQMNKLFEYIVTSRQWTDHVSQQFSEMMTAPTIDSTDQQLMISAVTLSLLNKFDMGKFRMLTEVYRTTQDEAVRQRALIGWVLGIDEEVSLVYPEQETLVRQLLQTKEVCLELTELQMQLVYCLNAEKDTNTIQHEIMPDLIKGNNLRFNQLGLEENEDDPMEDILHPGASEERMEKLEATYRRMMDMQKQGADIYFGGFSQMKRFPFFYDISNWLVPFYIQHPDIQQYVSRMEGNRFLQHIMANNMFCNNDKYSFVIAFNQVVNMLPESMREMLKRGEMSMDEFEDQTDETQTPAFLRRSYLMDLYRFFRLFPHRSEMVNPFNTEQSETAACEFFALRIFKNSPLDEHKREIVRMLYKQHYQKMAERVLSTFPESMQDAEYYLWMKDYQQALALEPDNERALAGHARQCFADGQYQQALADYDRLLQLKPERERYLLNKAVCLVNLEHYEEALKLLFQLNYEQPDNDSVNRALAWALTCQGKLEQASKYYQALTQQEHPTAEDYHNQGCCLWLQGHIDEAADSFRKYVEKAETGDAPLFLFEADWLRKRGLTDTDINIMEALVLT